MRGRVGRLLIAVLFAGIASPACRPPSLDLPAVAQDDPVVAEARAFMDAYARDLLAGDRAAIAARYDRTGAWLVREGEKSFVAYDAIVSRYARPAWSPPASFEWRDLSYETAGVDAVVVIGSFIWVPSAGANPIAVSYTALLERQDGELRIRVEDEKRIPTR